jgi:hypothetical protein
LPDEERWFHVKSAMSVLYCASLTGWAETTAAAVAVAAATVRAVAIFIFDGWEWRRKEEDDLGSGRQMRE